jgi:tRNA pseudouridine-54 N-methylase
MSKLFFILNAPPLSFTKNNLYEKDSKLNESAPFIKAISDSFFLSNQFRKNLFLYYITSFEGNPYVITFEGNKLRYLGPSFFSAAHLLLRAKNNIINPNSKNGKLTPGLSIIDQSSEWIFDKHKNDKIILVISSSENTETSMNQSIQQSKVFGFGFKKLPLSIDSEILLLKELDIDEQVIVLNYLLESDEK